MTRLLLATHNPGKRREMEALLKGLGLELHDLAGLGIADVAEETGSDYAANARLKALTYAQASGLWTLADDTGLEVDALEGAPGLLSARLLGPDHSDAERRQALLARLAPHPRPWTARFRCCAALASPSGSVDLAEGVCPGEVIPEERGEHGFGYDRIFLVAGTARTMAELQLEDKNRLSHRARAVQALLPTLRRRLGLR
ncbi:MAG: RdgB/HAM1 family non-canonical purine NTP pyrophosphatase [Chloroflexota bacterium]